MNTQDSTISKGLILHLQEAKTKFDNSYKCLDYTGSGRRWYNLLNSYSNVAISLSAFSTGGFSVFRKIRLSTLGFSASLISGGSNAFELYINTTGYLVAKIVGGSDLTASTSAITAQVEAVVGYVKSGNTGYYYINGEAVGTCTDNNNYSVYQNYAGKGSDNFILSDYMARVFNFALSSTDITYYSKPENPLKLIHKGTGTSKNILNLNAEGISANSWEDKTNSISYVVSGADTLIPVTSDYGAYYLDDNKSIEIDSISQLTGDISIVVQYNQLISDERLIFSNGKVKIFTTPYLVSVTSNDGARATADFIDQGDYVIILRKSNGYVTFVTRNKKYQAAQYSGTPATGGTINIGNFNFTGLVREVLIYNYILVEDVTDLIKELIVAPTSDSRTSGLAMRKLSTTYLRFTATGTLRFINN